MKPALAPSAVVAMSSPEPTIAAESMKPGPRYLSLPANVVGGERILLILKLSSEKQHDAQDYFYLLINYGSKVTNSLMDLLDGVLVIILVG